MNNEYDFEFDPRRMSVVDFAEQVLSMDRENRRLREENAELREYRRKYLKELDDGIAHSQHMLGGLLELAMKPGVLEAIGKANAEEVQP